MMGRRMATYHMSEIVQQLRRAVLLQDGAGLTDGQLLGCFIEHRDEAPRSEEHTSELQSHLNLVCRLLLEKKKSLMRLRTPQRPMLWSRTLHAVHTSPCRLQQGRT